MNTPWGESQGYDKLADGIEFHFTASHGGIVLNARRQKQIIERGYKPNSNWLKSNKYFEEDCDWAIPYVLFQNEIKNSGYLDKDQFEFSLKSAIATMNHYHNK